MSYLEGDQSYMTEVGGNFYTSDKNGESRKTFLRGHSIKEKAGGLFHRCFAHWPESSSVAGNGVIGSVEPCSTEGRFTPFRVLKKYTSRTAHIHSFYCLFLTQTQTLSKLVKNQRHVLHVCLTRVRPLLLFALFCSQPTLNEDFWLSSCM